MKRTLSLILAALILSSTITACGKTEPSPSVETDAVEKPNDTTVTETNAPTAENPATNAPETDEPTPVYPYDTSLITENGVAKAHIVVAEGADQLLSYAAEELVYHIKKVTGADIAVTNTAQADSLPIIIGTPDSHPELEALFPDDLAWLRTLSEEDGRHWGDDGFSIRSDNGKLYIFGATPRGSLNGVYDFIEDNMGVLWIRADDDLGLIYDEMPTLNVTKTNYKEKSPFQIRSSSGGGNNSDGSNIIGRDVDTIRSRNKLNTTSTGYPGPELAEQNAIGLQPNILSHNVTWWLTNSPTYDPSIEEYWETSPSGEHYTASTSGQVNFWSELTTDTVAESILYHLEKYADLNLRYVGVGMNDFGFKSGVYPEQTEPFEYAPGQFVDPSEREYISTVYFTFINRIARKIAERYPDVVIPTYAYDFAEIPPKCEIEDNVSVLFCCFHEDLSQPCVNEPFGDGPESTYKNLKEWIDKTPNLFVYSFYGCYVTAGVYERPIWYRIQNDFQYYAECGLSGVRPDMYKDTAEPVRDMGRDLPFNQSNIWEMNLLTHWLIFKLSWNPYEDVDALIEYFCDKVYGEASEHMQEYYRVLTVGWNDGAEYIKTVFNNNAYWNKNYSYYLENFIDTEVDGVHILTEIRNILDKAYDAASGQAKDRIGYVREVYSQAETIEVS